LIYPVETGLKPVCTDSKKNPEIKIHGVFEFIRALKSFSSRRINEKRNTQGVSNWQERFHDHIIRNETEYNRIENYIINNPKKWKEDCFF
jgi:putative transposase